MDREAVARLRALMAKATPGPWRIYCNKLRPSVPVKVIEVQQSNGRAVIPWAGFDHPDLAFAKRKANAALIAEAITALPALLALADAVNSAPECRVLEAQCSGFDDPNRDRIEQLIKRATRVRLVATDLTGEG